MHARSHMIGVSHTCIHAHRHTHTAYAADIQTHTHAETGMHMHPSGTAAATGGGLEPRGSRLDIRQLKDFLELRSPARGLASGRSRDLRGELGGGGGETLGCPLADPLEYLGFPKVTGTGGLKTRAGGHTGLVESTDTAGERAHLKLPAQTQRGKVGDRRASERGMRAQGGHRQIGQDGRVGCQVKSWDASLGAL